MNLRVLVCFATIGYIGHMTLAENDSFGLAFLKMHGLGNDFVIIDGRQQDIAMTPELARKIGDRHFGVGYDQLAVLTSAPGADVDVAFWNADGSTADACGNASRCIAHVMMNELDVDALTLRTGNGLLPAVRQNGLISVNMGQPVLQWDPEFGAPRIIPTANQC